MGQIDPARCQVSEKYDGVGAIWDGRVLRHRSGGPVSAPRSEGSVGALDVETPDGGRFLVGSGLSDALRRDPPSIGSTITYRCRDLTSTGLPRFATYWRRHDAL
jgi:hypothetical protein